MLGKTCIRFNLISFGLFARAAYLPFSPAITKGLLVINPRRMIIHTFCLLHSIGYVGFLILRLLLVLVTKERDANMVYIPLHVTYILGGTCMLAWELQLIYLERDLHIRVVRDMLSTVPEVRTGQRGFQDFVIQFIPLGIFNTFCAVCGLYVLLPESPQYMQSLLRFENGSMVPWMLMLYENAVILFWLGMYNYGLFVQTLFLQRSEHMLDDGCQKLKTAVVSMPELVQVLEGHVQACQLVVLRVQYFNTVFSQLAYALKLLGLGACILGIFLCLKLREYDMWLSLICGTIGFVAFCMYAFVYDRGSKLPQLFESYKLAIRRHGHVLQGHRRHALEASLKSLKTVHVIMGGFHTLERQSTLIFIHFCLASICNLIIGSPGQIQ